MDKYYTYTCTYNIYKHTLKYISYLALTMAKDNYYMHGQKRAFVLNIMKNIQMYIKYHMVTSFKDFICILYFIY